MTIKGTPCSYGHGRMRNMSRDSRGTEVNNWYQYRSKDRKQTGIVLARDEEAVAKFAGYPVSKLVIWRVEWNGERFIKEVKNELV